MSAPSTEQVSAFDGERLVVHRLGKGAPLLLLHGLFSDAETNWIKFGHAACLAATGYEVFMPDLRAHGDSAAPHAASAYPENILIRDAVSVVTHYGFDDYTLGGFSLGARTVLHGVAIGALKPSRLIAAGMGLQGLTGWRERAAFFRRVIDEFDTIKQGDPGYFARQFLKTQGVDRIAARHLLGSLTDLDPAMLPQIEIPTLVVCGTEDHDNGSAQDLADVLPNATHAAVPGTHMSSVTKPELGEAMAAWLREIA